MPQQQFKAPLSLGTCYSRERPMEEQGSIIVLTAIIIVALLTVAGLVVDGATLYRARIALQNAADAASLAAVNHVTTEGKLKMEEHLDIQGVYHADGNTGSVDGLLSQTPQTQADAMSKYLNPIAQNVAFLNLAEAGFPSAASGPYHVTFTGNYSPKTLSSKPDSAYEYKVTVSRRIDYYIMGYLPFTSAKYRDLTATATASRRIANAALILDGSSSMACPATGDCTCLTPARTGACASPTKFDKLLEGVERFLKMFDLENDKIGVIPFNVAANPATFSDLKELVKAEQGINKSYVTTEIVNEFIAFVRDRFAPVGVTNVCDGFMAADAQIHNPEDDDSIPGLGVSKTQNTAYVFFSDGAPTAGRFLFTDRAVKGALPRWGIGNGAPGLGKYDYVHHLVNWTDSLNVVRPGPAVMAQKGLYPFSWSSPSMPDEANLKENPAADIARCGSSPTLFPPVVSLDAGVKPLGTPGTSSYAAEQVFTPCLNSLESHIPNVPTSFYGGNYLPGEASTPGFKNWVEQYYNCGIQLADHMRLNETGTFYVIGLGAKATSGLPDDPYENAFDSQSRHDRWLARIALDAQMAGSPPMDFTYDGYMKWSDATAATPDRVGDYVATPSPAELELIFQRIGLRVLLKLVS